MNEENRQLIDSSEKPKGKKNIRKFAPNPELEQLRESKGNRIMLQDNVMEPDVETFQHTVPEESSRTFNSSSTAQQVGEAVDDVYDLENEENAEPHIIYDDPAKLIKQYEQRIIELEKDLEAYDELKQTYERVIPPYDIIETNEIDGKEYTHIIHVDPYKRTAWTEPDQQQKKNNKKK